MPTPAQPVAVECCPPHLFASAASSVYSHLHLLHDKLVTLRRPHLPQPPFHQIFICLCVLCLSLCLCMSLYLSLSSYLTLCSTLLLSTLSKTTFSRLLSPSFAFSFHKRLLYIEVEDDFNILFKQNINVFLITCTFSSLSSCLTMAWTTSLFPSSHALLNKREKCVNTSYVPTFCQKGKIFIYSCRIFCPLKEELRNIEYFVVLVERVLILIVEASGVCTSPQQYHCHLAKKKYHCHLGYPPVFLSPSGDLGIGLV